MLHPHVVSERSRQPSTPRNHAQPSQKPSATHVHINLHVICHGTQQDETGGRPWPSTSTPLPATDETALRTPRSMSTGLALPPATAEDPDSRLVPACARSARATARWCTGAACLGCPHCPPRGRACLRAGACAAGTRSTAAATAGANAARQHVPVALVRLLASCL